MLLTKRNPQQRAFDDVRNATSKVEDVNPHDIAIVGEIRKEYTLTQEIAIIRKALVSLGCNLPEFIEWNAKVNQIKNDLSKEE